jgi:hypothetical protein
MKPKVVDKWVSLRSIHLSTTTTTTIDDRTLQEAYERIYTIYKDANLPKDILPNSNLEKLKNL